MKQKRYGLVIVLGCVFGILYFRGIPPAIKIWPRWETLEHLENPDSDLFDYLLSFDELRIPQRKGALIKVNQIEDMEREDIRASEWLEIRLDSRLDFYQNDPVIGHQLFLFIDQPGYSINDFHSQELQHSKPQFDLIAYGDEFSLKCAVIPYFLQGFSVPPETRCEAIVFYGTSLVSKIDISNREEKARNPLNQEESTRILMEKAKIVDDKFANFTD